MSAHQWIDLISVLMIGLTVCLGPVLVIAYAWSDALPGKSWHALASSGLLTFALCVLQLYHLAAITGSTEPLDELGYRVAMFSGPPLLVLFGLALVRGAGSFPPVRLLHFATLGLLVIPGTWGLAPLLLIGSANAAWLGWLVFDARGRRPQHRFELLFAALMAVFGGAILVAAIAIPTFGTWPFYSAYAIFTGLAYLLVLFVLVAVPGFVDDVFEATRVRYASSTLTQVDVNAALTRLEKLMAGEELFRDESLTLRTLADTLEISSHQLSELVNRYLNRSFSQYLRGLRVAAAQVTLEQTPSQSVLSVGLECGFRSQSSFYAAFREETGLSPGAWRERQARRGAA